jgi:hypothetical protein
VNDCPGYRPASARRRSARGITSSRPAISPSRQPTTRRPPP